MSLSARLLTCTSCALVHQIDGCSAETDTSLWWNALTANTAATGRPFVLEAVVPQFPNGGANVYQPNEALFYAGCNWNFYRTSSDSA